MLASTSSDSALRRIRVARWSRRNRFSRVSGFSSRCSSWSMNDSCRDSRTWLRRATLTKVSAIEPRSAACSSATWTTVSLTALNAAARRPTSSSPTTSIRGSWTSGIWPGLRICSTIWGSSSRTLAAAAVSSRRGREMRRASMSDASTVIPTPSTAAMTAAAARTVADDAARSDLPTTVATASSTATSRAPTRPPVVCSQISGVSSVGSVEASAVRADATDHAVPRRSPVASRPSALPASTPAANSQRASSAVWARPRNRKSAMSVLVAEPASSRRPISCSSRYRSRVTSR